MLRPLIAAGTLVLLVAASACGARGATPEAARSFPLAAGTSAAASTSAAPSSEPVVVTEAPTTPAVVAVLAAPPVPVARRTPATTRAVVSPAPKPAPKPPSQPVPAPVPKAAPKPAPQPAAKPAPKPAQQAVASGCNSNYTPCVPNDPKDVDCQGGSGNGPSYVKGPVTVTGTDVYGLDADHNGIGCE